MSKQSIAVAIGDGIGPEIMQETLQLLTLAGAKVNAQFIEAGEKVYRKGFTSGISDDSWNMIRQHKILLKAPITTPQGGGYKSLNVTLRKTLGLFANVRPVRSYYPFVQSKHPIIDIVIIRENEEDLYAGIEHQQTDEVVQCLKLITRAGCEKIIRFAFEYARQNGRKKVTCFTKDNIMKQTDGLFHKVFDEIGQLYPELQQEHMIIDIGAARLADTPEIFDVIVTTNLYGDIISDIAAQIAGSVGLAGSANIGEEYAMFEAIHGSAPDIAGKNIANPSGLLQGSVMMLNYIGQNEVGEKIQNAWLRTIEEGIHTGDIYKQQVSTKKVSTTEFMAAVAARLGQKPLELAPALAVNSSKINIPPYTPKEAKKKELLGVDIFIDWKGKKPNELGNPLSQLKSKNLSLKMITNRGVKVWPGGFDETFCTDHWRCRFMSEAQQPITQEEVIELLQSAVRCKFDVIKTENLYQFDGTIAFSLGQGQ